MRLEVSESHSVTQTYKQLLLLSDGCRNNTLMSRRLPYIYLFFSADMQHGGSYGGDLLFGEISYHQRGPGGRIIYDLLYVTS